MNLLNLCQGYGKDLLVSIIDSLSFKMFICAGAFSILSNIYNETFTKIINGLKLTIFLKNSTLGI